MSAAGRGPRRGGEHDYYPTPAWCVARLLEAWTPRPGLLVDPCAGDGAIIRAVPGREWMANDLRAECAPRLRASGVAAPQSLDFLARECDEWIARSNHATAIVTNPPFSLAEQFVWRCLSCYPRADVAMLLRLDFLATAGRHRLVRAFAPDVYVIPDRPSFTCDGRADSQSYAWMIWPAARSGPVGAISVLALTPAHERHSNTTKGQRHGKREQGDPARQPGRRP